MIRAPLLTAATLLLVLAGGALGFFLYSRLAFGLTLTEQAALLHLPGTLLATARATQPVAIRLHGRIDAQVPLRQTLTVPLKGSYPADIVLDAVVPLRMLIHYQGQVPVRATAAIRGDTGLVFHTAMLPRFPLTVKVPLDFQLPITLNVPVDTQLHLVYRGPIELAFDQDVSAPMNTVLNTHMIVDRDVDAPILKSFDLSVSPLQASVPVTVKQAELRLALPRMGLQRSRP